MLGLGGKSTFGGGIEGLGGRVFDGSGSVELEDESYIGVGKAGDALGRRGYKGVGMSSNSDEGWEVSDVRSGLKGGAEGVVSIGVVSSGGGTLGEDAGGRLGEGSGTVRLGEGAG